MDNLLNTANAHQQRGPRCQSPMNTVVVHGMVKNDKFDLAMSSIENALVFASLDAASVDFKITISNDTRNKILFRTVDSFVDGVPYDLNEFDLAPRAEINILSSDVSVGLFFQRGWYKLGEFYYLDGT